ncbi:MAG TPA: ABC transporter ATP-binding protein [Acidimicrobiia bacterium]|nr:ABC transporter ATP-binding protein [Acidimicrobiia bacterium]HZQ79782.1 ABC transporter ATP-binding protein [Acidimicrobiia bacterium]
MLRLDGIRAGYGQATVLRDVSVVVPDGAAVALLGPNGAGKTTLLRVASGLLRPFAGRVVLDGEDVTAAPPQRRRRLGLCHVPERGGVFADLTVAENLRLFAPPGHEDEAVDRAVAAFPALGSRLGQPAGTLSGGEQQMVALSRVHGERSRVVLLDEVSMGLAPRLVDTIFAFLEGLAASGVSLLVVEQYVAKALAIADYVCLLDRGRTSFVGEPGELDSAGLAARYLGGAQA